MSRPKTLIDEALIELVETDLAEIKDYETVIKLKAIKASINHSETEVASIFDIARSTLERWISNYRKFGIEGIKNKSRGHNPSKLSLEEKNIIKEWILTGKDNNGKQVHWTLKRLVKEISLVFQKEITKTPLWLTLKSMNLSVKRPRPKHYKADESEQADFKKNSNND